MAHGQSGQKIVAGGVLLRFHRAHHIGNEFSDRGIDGRKSGGIGSGQRGCRAVETVFIYQPQEKICQLRIKLPATIFKKFLADGFR